MYQIVNKDTDSVVFESGDIEEIKLKKEQVILARGNFNEYAIIRTDEDIQQDDSQGEKVAEEEIAETSVRKVFIRGYGNLLLQVTEMNEIGVYTFSEKNQEILFIPWSSIIMISDKISHDKK